MSFTTPLRVRLLASITALGLGASLVACSDSTMESASDSSSASQTTTTSTELEAPGDEAAFPMTIKHHFGETTIEKAPVRIATVAWSNHEVPLALGVVPVGMTKSTWGDDDDNGVLPWVEERLAELGAETPVLFDETDALPFEQIADTKPDVILAAYSGLTQEDYDTLSEIAPVIAYPDMAWGTSLDELIDLNSRAIGMEDEGEKLEAKLKEKIEQALNAHPELKGKNVLFSSFGDGEDNSTIGFYTTKDPRAGFLKDVGFGVPKVVEEASKDADTFWVTRSAEQPEAFDDVDIFISYGSDNEEDNKAQLAAMQADPLLGRIPAIAKGNVVFLGNGPLAAAVNFSPLSVNWAIDDYFELLAGALKN